MACRTGNVECAFLQEDLSGAERRLASAVSSCGFSRIFLTGGTGFFGKWLLHSYVALRQRVQCPVTMAVLSRSPADFLDKNPWFKAVDGLDFIEGDVRTFDFDQLPPFDCVIHGATCASAQLEREQPDEMFAVIAEGTRHLLEFTRRCGARRLLFISSGAVYGPQPASVSHLPESHDGEPVTAYGKGKKLAEHLCLEESQGRFECVIARPFAFVGPYLPLDAHFAIGNFIRDCLEDRDIVIQGDGTPLRSYLYAADLAEWLWTILLRGAPGRAYNVGSNEAIAILDLARLVRTCAGTENEIVVREKTVDGAAPAQYVPSAERAMSELGLAVRFGLSAAVRRTLAWHRQLRVKGSGA